MDPTENLIDQVLILRFQTGDHSAFEKIVERYHGRLLYYIRRILARADNADDILQEVWLAAFRQLRTLKNPEAFPVWLYRVARNKAIGELRANRLVPRPVEDIAAPDEPDNTEEFSADNAAQVHAGLDKLRPEHKEVLVLRFLEQMSYQDIAAVVGCRLGTVRSRIYYAKGALRKEMEETINDK